MKDTIKEEILWLSNDELLQKKEKIAREIQKYAEIPGFRPGKAPFEIVRKKFEERITRDATDALIHEKLSALVNEKKLHIITPAEIKEKEEDENGIRIKVAFEVIPDFDIVGYDLLPVTRKIKRITKEDVEKRLKVYQESLAEFVPKDGEIEENDLVLLRYTVFDKRGKIITKDKEERFEFIPGNVLPEFYNALKGKKKKESLEVKIDKGEEQRIYKIKVLDVKGKILPPIDDNFAKNFGFKDIKEFEKTVEKEVQEEISKASERELEGEIVQKLLDINPFDVPDRFVEEEINSVIEEYKIAEEEKEKFIDKIRALARSRVRARLLLDKIAEKAGYEVTEDEVNEEVKKIAEEYKTDFQSLKAGFEKKGTIENLRIKILRKKAIEFLKSRAKIEVIIE